MRTRVKICGITREQDARAAVAAGADALGFVFWEGSPRQVDPARAAAIGRTLPPFVARVGVFVDAVPADVTRIVRLARLQAIQLHGDEDADAYARCGAAIIKAVALETVADVRRARAVPGSVLLLVDACDPGRRGGTGMMSNWPLARALARHRPILLAGGITPANVRGAVRAVRPWGIDVSSGVETRPGLKSGRENRGAAGWRGAGGSGGMVTGLRAGTPGPVFGRRDPDHRGYFGEFGGRYMPETLMAPVEALEAAYFEARADPAFVARLCGLLDTYVGRPTPLHEARGAAGRPDVRLFLKREDLAHTGAHKINNALGQALLAARMGKRRVVAETGAGQHGVASATACALLGLECIVYMGAEDMARQALNVFRMQVLGAQVERVNSGSRTLKDAINEALRDWVANAESTYYLLGSVLGPHPYPLMVREFQSVIGQEARRQILDAAGRLPDLVVACVGGGSNALGLFDAFIDDAQVRLVGVEAGGRGVTPGDHAARFAGGAAGVLHGTRTLVLQDEAGNILPTHSVSAGLDYPAVGPEHAWLAARGRTEYAWVDDAAALEGFAWLARREGILPALESSHALAWARRELPGLPAGAVVLVNVSGRGDKDVETVRALLGGRVDAGGAVGTH